MELVDAVDMFEVVRANLDIVSRLPASSSPTVPNLMVAPGRGKGRKTSLSGWLVGSKATFSAIVAVGSKLLPDVVCRDLSKRDEVWSQHCTQR